MIHKESNDANVELEINVGLDVASMPQHANAARKRSRSDSFVCGDVVAEAQWFVASESRLHIVTPPVNGMIVDQEEEFMFEKSRRGAMRERG